MDYWVRLADIINREPIHAGHAQAARDREVSWFSLKWSFPVQAEPGHQNAIYNALGACPRTRFFTKNDFYLIDK
jgi:hypothetical protein